MRGVGGVCEGCGWGVWYKGRTEGGSMQCRKECVCMCVCVGGEGGRGCDRERERGGKGEGRCRAGECVCVERIWRGGRRRRVCVFTKSGGEMGGEKSVAQRKTGLLTSR